MRTPRIHYLRGNKVERSPHRLFVYDTETRTIPEGKREVMPLRVWAAEVVQRHGRRPTRPALESHRGTDAAGLCDALEGACRSSETTWAFAHNAGFDLAVTRLPLLLLLRGWVVTAHALTTDSPWARLVRGSHRLVLADSSSWLPGKLAEVGAHLGIEKPELPAEAAGDSQWWWRCTQDVVILRTVLCELMDWWDRTRRGSWSVTGPQTGFNLMRHMPQSHHVVIDPDPDARAFERRGIMAGRREVWRVGRLPWGDYRELDFRSAHATVAAYLPLPKRRSVCFETLDVADWRIESERWSVMAECTLQVNTPRYPLTYRGRLWYPVGRFRTVLCGPEIREARRRGELLAVGPGYVYQLGQHMADWGRWVLTELATEEGETPASAYHAIKAWSRVVPGKWATRTGREVHSGPACEQGWNVEHGRHHPSGAPVSILDMAGRREVVLQDQDAEDCFPAVLAWIQSEVRVRLGRLIDWVTPEYMVSCNTDGVICQRFTDWCADELEAQLWPLRAREKARYEWVEVLSPQHLILPGERRLSGVPASADEVAPHEYSWMTWPRLPSQIAAGEPRGYVRELRSADLSHVPVNRWVGEEGWCLPVRAEIGEDGETRLLPPTEFITGDPWAGLRPLQHPVLMGLSGPR